MITQYLRELGMAARTGRRDIIIGSSAVAGGPCVACSGEAIQHV